jgi:hypothetical protein
MYILAGLVCLKSTNEKRSRYCEVRQLNNETGSNVKRVTLWLKASGATYSCVCELYTVSNSS